ncbi:unnamed protein product [Adineta steineri]|uniref:G domain-containing protein n=1 Tax=Adineta steineri TaxID=433720 RepID=A0A815WAC7_9BILA|nr:unnamed protein product [Adineta steineri]CAF1542315.1 unnamed protein product [Adineta steineri]
MPEETSSQIILDTYLGRSFIMDRFATQIQKKGFVNRILIIGQTGVGKSSVVNLLADEKKANVSDAAVGCTFSFDSYHVMHNDQPYELIDTIGLNEGSKGKVIQKEALKKLITFIKQNKRGFNCVLFVIKKGRVDDAFEKNHYLFYKTLLQEKIPAILFVGHCEQDEPMSAWYLQEENVNFLHPYHFSQVVCSTALEGGRFAEQIKPLREETRTNLWKAIVDKMLDKPIPVEADLNMIKRLWNGVCDYFGFTWKFVTDQFKSFLEYLRL